LECLGIKGVLFLDLESDEAVALGVGVLQAPVGGGVVDPTARSPAHVQFDEEEPLQRFVLQELVLRVVPLLELVLRIVLVHQQKPAVQIQAVALRLGLGVVQVQFVLRAGQMQVRLQVRVAVGVQGLVRHAQLRLDVLPFSAWRLRPFKRRLRSRIKRLFGDMLECLV